MKQNKIFILLYLILNVIAYVMILSSLLFFEHEQKNKIATTAANLTREHFLISDYSAVLRALEKVKGDEFEVIHVFNKDHKLIAEVGEKRGLLFWVIKKNIWLDRESKYLKGVIHSQFSLDQIIKTSLQVLMLSILFTLPAFLFFIKKWNQRQLGIIENERNKIRTNLTRQMSHDIRSPIATINNLFENLNNLSPEELEILKASLQRVNKLANLHLEDFKTTLHDSAGFHSIKRIITEVVKEKIIEHPKAQINLTLADYLVFCNSDDLKIILSNLINNSVEACVENPELKIELLLKDKQVIISIEDNGSGIPNFVLEKAGKTQVSSKPNGNGLGLKHAIEVLLKWNAQLNIIKTNSSGTRIELELLSFQEMIVLVDNDELTRINWETKAKQLNLLFKSFRSYKELSTELEQLSKKTVFFIDSELDDNEKGEDLARIIFEKGYLDVSLATGHAKSEFSELTFLKAVVGKGFPFS